MIAYRPRPPLDLFVELLWWSRRAEPSMAREHMLPSGKAQLVIPLHGEPLTWAADRGDESHPWTAGIVHGPQSSYYLTGPKPRGAVMGASVRPGAAGALFGVPAGELADRHISIFDLWGSHGRDLQERLAGARTPEAALVLLEEALVARLRRPLLLHPAVVYALRECTLEVPRKSVAEIQRETGYSAKHFIALFRAAVGSTPKQYLRIQRFGRVLEQLAARQSGMLAAGQTGTLAAGRSGTLCDIAAATGYSDQSHLTREFRELAGITPTEYRPAARASRHHHIVATSAI